MCQNGGKDNVTSFHEQICLEFEDRLGAGPHVIPQGLLEEYTLTNHALCLARTGIMYNLQFEMSEI